MTKAPPEKSTYCICKDKSSCEDTVWVLSGGFFRVGLYPAVFEVHLVATVRPNKLEG